MLEYASKNTNHTASPLSQRHVPLVDIEKLLQLDEQLPLVLADVVPEELL
jgi:hypothetical protein